ncbi:hypothetical protein [Aeromonas phage 14AhydR10PP]|nr:hypothetical protein [Aeromonas phage 14AhydR10PP]
MRVRDGASVITPLLFLIGLCALSVWKSDQEVARREAAITQAAQEGREWMQDTTAKLEATLAGIERLTGETVELAQQVDAMADRMDMAGI